MSDRSGSDSEPEEDYEVEEIRDKRRGDDGDWLYYVKWVGWESDTNTWEPVEHLEESKELLEEFERKWRRKQEKKELRRREERERKLKERRERELKNAARLKVDSDSDGGGYNVERKKEKKRIVSDSGSDSDGEKRKKDRDREREKEKSKKHKRDKEKRREGGDLFKADGHSSKKKEEAPKKESKPKYFRDIKPEKILGVTTDPGQLYFYIKWEGDRAEPGLVSAKEAYQKIPQMCLKFYESHLVWNKKETKEAPLVKEMSIEKDAEKQKDPEKVQRKESVDKVQRRESVESKGSDSSKTERKERPPSSAGDKLEATKDVPANPV